jgi:hypothetical protein
MRNVLSNLTELHDQIHKGRRRCRISGKVGRLSKKFCHRAIGTQSFVEISLTWRQLAIHIDLNLSILVSKTEFVTIGVECTFSPNSFCTFRFTRRNMNGFKIICSLLSWCSLNPPPLDPAAPSMSFENHSENSSCESNKLGMIK